MFPITKKLDVATGKTTYSRTLGGHTATCVASCEEEAKGKLGSDLLCALGLDGVIETVEATVKSEYMEKIDAVIAERNGRIIILQEALEAEKNKSWLRKLGESFWRA